MQEHRVTRWNDSSTDSNVWGFSHTTKPFSHTGWMSYDSTQFWHWQPRDTIRFYRFGAQSHKTVPTSPSYHLYFWPTGLKSEVPTTPCLDLVNLLEQLTEFRKPVYSLDYCLLDKIIKGENEQPDEDMHRVRSWTKERLSSCSLGPCTVAHVSILAHQPEPRPFGFSWRLRYTGMIS